MKRVLRVAIFAGSVLVSRGARAQSFFTFEAPHHVRAASARLDTALARSIDDDAHASSFMMPDDVVTFALRHTSSALHFGLHHATRLSFDTTEREGNCVEYAELFAAIFNRERIGVTARAWIVRSDATMLGQSMRDPAWRDHDWVLVVVQTPNGVRRIFVDPTLADMGLGWDISSDVRGVPQTP